jgi:uncharacterized protein YgiM (DUF1202 family)
MSKNGIAVLIIAAIAFFAGGFFLGQGATAIFNAPGSKDNPLVSESYVVKLVGERTAAIQTQIEELQGEIEDLKNVLATSGNNAAEGENTPPAEGGETSSQNVIVTANSINIRAEASTGSQIVGSAVKGDKFPLLATEGEWYKIRLSNGSEAYIASFLGRLE